MSKMTDKMSEAGSGRPMTQDAGLAANPKKGEHYRCPNCGMEVASVAR